MAVFDKEDFRNVGAPRKEDIPPHPATSTKGVDGKVCGVNSQTGEIELDNVMGYYHDKDEEEAAQAHIGEEEPDFNEIEEQMAAGTARELAEATDRLCEGQSLQKVYLEDCEVGTGPRQELPLLPGGTLKPSDIEGKTVRIPTYQDDLKQQQPAPPAFNRNSLMEFAVKTCKDGILLAYKKSRDYSTFNEPLCNFKRAGAYGIAVRMDDKVGRLLNLLQGQGTAPAVEDETAEETFRDLLNYAWLGLAVLAEKRHGR